MNECHISEKQGQRPQKKEKGVEWIRRVKEASFEALVARNNEALRKLRRKDNGKE
jgi:hypothetical protein